MLSSSPASERVRLVRPTRTAPVGIERELGILTLETMHQDARAACFKLTQLPADAASLRARFTTLGDVLRMRMHLPDGNLREGTDEAHL